MKISVSSPNLKDILRGTEDDIAASVQATMVRVTDGLKTDLRAQVTGAGLGSRVAQAWRGNTYPRSGNSLDAASFVYSNASKIVSAFSQGVTIRSKHGRFLAIPTEYAGRGPGGARLTPSTWEQRTGVKLQFIKNGVGACFLIAKLRVRSGKAGARNATKYAAPTPSTRKQKLETVVIFQLIPSARIPKLFDLNEAANRWANLIPGILGENWKA